MEWHKDIKFNKRLYRIKKADDGKHKYVAWTASKMGDKYLLSAPVRFGALGMEHYKDKFKQYSQSDHKDKKRLENFRSRFGSKYEKIKNDPGSALFWSWNYLW